jgi:class 3 adenylate cyclase
MPKRPPNPAAHWLAEARRHEHSGELFRAYDVARQGLAHFPDDLALKHRAVLCLASTGATRQAVEELARLGLDPVPDISPATGLGLDIAALKPRLLKDAALATTGRGRSAALAKAADAYEAVYRKAAQAGNREAYYPCVNAASLNLLAGNEAAAFRLAAEVLSQLAAWPAGDKSFYEIASELEACLVLGRLDEARRNIASVRTRVRSTAQADYRGLSSMVRQLRLIIEAKGLGSDWLEALAPPRVIHYLGHIIAPPGMPGRFAAEEEPAAKAAIEAMLAAEDVGFAYGSLAAGADILFAEALLARNADLHIVLPFDREEFIEVSVRPAGEHWVRRFRRCFAAARRNDAVHFATADRYLHDDHLFGYCSELAMGLALLRARHLSSAAEQIVVWDGKPAAGPAGTAADVARWRHTGMPQKVIPVGRDARRPGASPSQGRVLERRTHAMLFGDMHGFSKLTDAQLPSFIASILGSFARVVERNQRDILLANTWGDGLFLVFEDAGQAAACALELQETVERIDLRGAGLPAEMGLRIGLHLGPVYGARDPVLKRRNFFGAHVSRAARIEPVTPERSVYVTETMAAVLALHNSDRFTCEYVGMTKAAKHYGQMRMFLLGRRG